jgi:hypothetical protein
MELRCDSVCPRSGHLGAWQVSGVRKLPAPERGSVSRSNGPIAGGVNCFSTARWPAQWLRVAAPRSSGQSCAKQHGHCRFLGFWKNPGKEKGRTLLRPFHNQHMHRLPHPRFSESHHNWGHAAPNASPATREGTNLKMALKPIEFYS